MLIFANPPFTAGKHLSNRQKDQLYKLGLTDNLDAAFIVKAAQENLYGVWIVNASIVVTKSKVFNKVCHTTLGGISVSPSSKIASGGSVERYLFTSSGTGGCPAEIKSTKMLTDWAVFVGSFGHACKKDDNGDLVCTYGGRIFKCKVYNTCNPEVDYIMPQTTNNGVWIPKHPILPNVAGNPVLSNPTSWTLRAVQSRAFFVWSCNVEPTFLLGHNGVLSVVPAKTRSVNTFPLFQGDDLTHYDTMTDEEIFQELFTKYNKLIK